MPTVRAIASVPLLVGCLLLAACNDKGESEPLADTLGGKPATAPPTPTQAPEVAQPETAAPTATATAGAIPPSGDPATRTNPKFHLPADGELTTTASGLKYLVLREGSGTSATLTGNFSAHYCGWFTNGEKFDSSYERNEPLAYPVARMIKGWQEALVTLMKPGSEYILVVPPELGYGAGGNGIPADSTLVFRMELLAVSG